MTIPDRHVARLKRAIDEIRDDRDTNSGLTEKYKDPIRLARQTFKDQGVEIDGSVALTPEVAFRMPSPVNQDYLLFLERNQTEEGLDRFLVNATVPSLGTITMFTMTGWDAKRAIEPDVRDWRGRPATEEALSLASSIITHINTSLTPR